MLAKLHLQSKKYGELNKFLSKYYETNLEIENKLSWDKEFQNPVDIADFIGVYVDNSDEYEINMWITLDKDTFINISEQNANIIIKYLFERYPY